MPYVAEFSLSVTRALRDQLAVTLDGLTPTPLTAAAVAALDRRGGVYELFDDGVLVYVGKSTRDLPGRLTQHRIKISGRVGDLIDHITFCCAYVDEDLDAVAPETLLIAGYRGQGLAAWNTNGFGNKDPGKQRDTSEVKAAHFDALHPINLDLPVTITPPDAPATIDDMLWAVKGALPYNFRFDQTAAVKTTLAAIPVDPAAPGFLLTRTAREWFEWLASALPPTWTIVALPGYVVAYPNRPASRIPSRIGFWERTGTTVVFATHTAQLAAGAVPVEPEDDGE